MSKIFEKTKRYNHTKWTQYLGYIATYYFFTYEYSLSQDKNQGNSSTKIHSLLGKRSGQEQEQEQDNIKRIEKIRKFNGKKFGELWMGLVFLFVGVITFLPFLHIVVPIVVILAMIWNFSDALGPLPVIRAFFKNKAKNGYDWVEFCLTLFNSLQLIGATSFSAVYFFHPTWILSVTKASQPILHGLSTLGGLVGAAGGISFAAAMFVCLGIALVRRCEAQKKLEAHREKRGVDRKQQTKIKDLYQKYDNSFERTFNCLKEDYEVDRDWRLANNEVYIWGLNSFLMTAAVGVTILFPLSLPVVFLLFASAAAVLSIARLWSRSHIESKCQSKFEKNLTKLTELEENLQENAAANKLNNVEHHRSNHPSPREGSDDNNGEEESQESQESQVPSLLIDDDGLTPHNGVAPPPPAFTF